MLIEFSVTNFRSYKDRQVLSMLPSAKVKERTANLLSNGHYNKLAALPSMVIYGANNSGKTNLLMAFRALRWLVMNSNGFNSDRKLEPNEYFYFDVQTKNQPTTFEIDFIAPNSLRYSYSLTFNQKEILKEELYRFNNIDKRKLTISTLFVREKGKPIKFGEALGGKKKDIEATMNPNQLFLSKADASNQEQLRPVYQFFAEHLGVFVFEDSDYESHLLSAVRSVVAENVGTPLFDFIKKTLTETGTGILGLNIEEVDKSKIVLPESISDDIKSKILESLTTQIMTIHKLFDGKKEVGLEKLPLSEQSTGTRKLIAIGAIIFQALRDGDTIFIDELDKSLHTHLTKTLINLFHNPKTNPKNAQLVITTHDATLLDGDFFGKDQKIMVEKDKYGVTEVYSLADLTGIRKEVSFQDLYLAGRFGAVPNINKNYLFNQVSQLVANGETY
jgi:uncharacterized protein